MIDLARIVGFEWDAGNARKNEKHGVSQSEAEPVDEPRYHALGTTLDRRHVHITFTLRAEGTLIRVVSARDMHRKERQIYDRED